jgi:hypothetical protein
MIDQRGLPGALGLKRAQGHREGERAKRESELRML